MARAVAGPQLKAGGRDSEVAHIGPVAGGAAGKVLSILHALAGREGDGFVCSLAGNVIEYDIARQRLVRGMRLGQQAIIGRHVEH